MHPQIQVAIDLAQAGDKPRALEIINQLLAQDARHVEGWLMMAALTEDEEHKAKYLFQALSIDPQNQIAREELVEMKRMPPQAGWQPARPSLMQSALMALKEGNKPKALEYLKQRINEDPKDADPWVIMTQLVADPARQRQYLQYALKLNPNHQGARGLMIVLDRVAPVPTAPNATATQTPAPAYASQTISPAPQAAAQKKAAPQVYKFRYPLLMRLVVYGMALGALAILIGGQAGQMGPYFWPVALVAVAAAWVASVRVEIDASEVRVVQFFIRKALKWDDITRMRTGVQRYHLQLIGSNGRSLKINSQVAGYDSILALIRQRRPDLFSEMDAGKTFSDYRVFKKSLVKYIVVVIGVILVFLGIPVFWAPTWGDRFGFLLLIAIGLYLIILPLFGVRQVKVEPGILTLDWLFRNEEYRPRHIEAIYMETMRNRYGTAHHYIVIKPQDEKAITLNDFGGDTDLLYGVLMNWWKTGVK